MSSIFLKDIGCDFKCRRNKIMDELKKTYENSLKEYTTIYRQYMSYRYDRSINRTWKRNYAEQNIRPTLVRLNTILNNSLTRLRTMYEETQKVLERNDNELTRRTTELLEKNRTINEQVGFIQNRYADLKSKEKQIEWNKTKNLYKKRIMNMLLIFNFLLLIGIGVTFFLGSKKSAGSATSPVETTTIPLTSTESLGQALV